MEIGIDSFGAVISDPATGLTLSPVQRTQNLLEEIALADQVGLDVFGVGEHHRSEFVDSAPVVILAAAAARTQKIRLTTWAIQRKKLQTISTQGMLTRSRRSARNEAGHRQRGLNLMLCEDRQALCWSAMLKLLRGKCCTSTRSLADFRELHSRWEFLRYHMTRCCVRSSSWGRASLQSLVESLELLIGRQLRCRLNCRLIHRGVSANAKITSRFERLGIAGSHRVSSKASSTMGTSRHGLSRT
jgi:hypothetical protein